MCSIELRPRAFVFPIDSFFKRAKPDQIKYRTPLIFPKYNSLGTFEKGWNIDTGGGKFYLWATDHKVFYIYAVRTRKYLCYDMEGNLINSETISSSERDNILPEMPVNKIEIKDQDGNHFIIKKDSWIPEVVKISNNRETTLLKDPFGFLPKTVPMFIIAFISAVMTAFLFIAMLLMYGKK